MDLAKIARIVGLRNELRRKRSELEGLVIEYIKLNRAPKNAVAWRKLARRIRMDHMQLFKFARSKGLIADKEQEPATATAEEAV